MRLMRVGSLFVGIVILLSFLMVPAAAQSTPSERTVTGEFVVLHGDNFETGAHTIQYALRLDGGALLDMNVPRDLVAQLGGVLDADGKRVTVALNRSNRAKAITVEGSGTRGDWGDPGPSAHWLNLLCKFSDVAFEPATPAKVQSIFEASVFNRMPDYFLEMTGGVHTVTADTTEWAVMSLTQAEAFVAAPDTLKQACFAAHGVDLSTLNVNMMFNTDFSLAVVGLGGGRLTWLAPNAYMYCEPLSHCESSITVLAHEMGHAYGMPHSDNNDGDGDTYDNTWDVMSSTGDPYEIFEGTERFFSLKPYNNYYRWKVGFLDGSDVHVVPSGTDAVIEINNFHNAALPGKQLAIMPLNGTIETATRLIAVEVRHGVTGGGYEDALPYRDGVLVYEIDLDRLAAPAILLTSVSQETSFAEAALGPGHDYVDDATGARVEVLAPVSGGYSVSMRNTGPAVAPAVSIDDATWAETDAGSANLTFTVSVSAPVAQAVTVSYATSDHTAAAGLDYVAKTGSVTIPASTAGATFSVSVLGDTLSELTETFGVSLVEVTTANASLGDRTAVGILQDNDPVVKASIQDMSVAEGDAPESTMHVTANLSAPSGRPVWLLGGTDGWLNYPNRCGLLDVRFEKRNMMIFFPPGSTSATIPVKYCGNDLADGNKTFGVSVWGMENAVMADEFIVAGVTILDDDGPPTLPAISLGSAAQWHEGIGVVQWHEGVGPMVFHIGVDRTTTEPIVLSVSTIEYGIATPDVDFVSRTNVEVVIPPGQGRHSVPFEVELLDDANWEYMETFAVVPTIVSGSAQLGPNWRGEGQILNDEDLAPLTIAIEDSAPFNEGFASLYPMQFFLSFNRMTSRPITLNVSTSNGTATAGTDFESVSTQVVIPANTSIYIIDMPILDDAVDEETETFDVTISIADGDATITQGTAVGTIVDNDDGGEPPPATVSIDDVSADEDSGLMTFTATVSTPSPKKILLSISTAGGGPNPATAGVDFVPWTDITVKIPANTTSHTFSIALTDDGIAEADETFIVEATLVKGNVTMFDGTAIGTIVDDDGAGPIGIAINGAAAAEADGEMTFTVTASTASAGDVVFDLATGGVGVSPATEGADFVSLDGQQVVLPAGETSVPVTVTLITDNLIEATETFDVTLTVVSGSAVLTDGTGAGALADTLPDGVVNLVANGGFEAGKPPWSLTYASGTAANDKIKCSDTSPVGNASACGMKFKGKPRENTKLKQTIDLSAVTIAAGDGLQAVVSYKAKKPTKLKLAATVTFNDGTAKQKLKLSLTAATANAWVTSLTAPTPISSADIKSIKVQIAHTMTSGSTFIDDVALYLIPSGPRGADPGSDPLDPDGFRRGGEVLPLPGVSRP